MEGRGRTESPLGGDQRESNGHASPLDENGREGKGIVGNGAVLGSARRKGNGVSSRSLVSLMVLVMHVIDDIKR